MLSNFLPSFRCFGYTASLSSTSEWFYDAH